MSNTADVTGGKPIAVWSQFISGVNAINALVAFTTSMEERERYYSFICHGHHAGLFTISRLNAIWTIKITIKLSPLNVANNCQTYVLRQKILCIWYHEIRQTHLRSILTSIHSKSEYYAIQSAIRLTVFIISVVGIILWECVAYGFKWKMRRHWTMSFSF
jgi:hypothetical protein